MSIGSCITCFKAKPTFYQPLMGELPASSTTPARPFIRVGCDFAGPILVKENSLRCKKLAKTYFCIFVCFVTRAVHIELAGYLSTPCFLNVLKRFVSRRGLCSDIYSDNGTNFVGACQELKTIVKGISKAITVDDDVKQFLLKHKINWHFILPRAPHFGGLWETAVKSAKYHLVRILKDSHLTFEHLYTV